MKRLAYIPNSITLLRILLTPLITLFIANGKFSTALSLFVLAAFTDYLDGYFARRLKVTSPLGALLDPLADKILLFSLLPALMVRGFCPSWFLGIVLTVNIIQCLGFVLFNWPKSPLKSNFTSLRIGKWNTTLQLLWLGFLILEALLANGHGTVPMPWGNFSVFLALSLLQFAVFFSYFFYFRIHLTPDFRMLFPTHTRSH